LALTPGARLGVYEVIAQIGEGGMGQVYRARDTKLNRDVALKILPDAFASDGERLTRFTREAQALAALNHPNIAAIYGLEESGGMTALVMELVEGDDLSQRIARGAIPLDEALPIAKQIAEALEAAHEQGIIHRDLKPANIKVRADGMVKVLDFGLAKAMEPIGAMAASNSMSPTITTPAMMTSAGMILGTAAYMSPEQARGKSVDKRADIWAFGAVLFEMLTGTRAFVGDDVSDVLASVLAREPDLTAASPRVRLLLTRCLEKDSRKRLRDIGDAMSLVQGADTSDLSAEGAAARIETAPLRSNRVAWLVAAVATIALIATALVALRRAGEVTPTASPVQFTIAPPDNTSFGGPAGGGTGYATQLAVSPDGRNIVLVAGTQAGYQIWLRPVATLAARPIPGTEGGAFPFWSPDGRSIGFFAAGKLKKVQIAGGPPTVLCDAPAGRGGSWSRDDVILFTPSTAGGLVRVTSAGGVPTVVTTLDPATGETNHRWPYFLPDGQHFIYTAVTGTCCPATKPSRISIASLDPADPTISLLQAESSASYASGHLLFARDETLMAQLFDLDARQLKGDAFPLAEHVSRESGRYVGASVSENGTLVYAHGAAEAASQLTWFDRTGRALATVGEAVPYFSLALSPDERRVAIALRTSDNLDIWITDIARNIRSRLTVDPGTDTMPVWSPDGTRIAFGGQRSGKISLRQKLIDATAPDELLLEGSGDFTPTDWSADGRFIAYADRSSAISSDLWALPLFGDRKPFPLAQTEFAESSAVFSPDGRSIAYSSTEGGQPNVYVQPFPAGGGRYQVSRDGGSRPVWRANGKELFYLGLDGTMMAVPIDATGPFDAGVPQALFPTGAPTLNVNQVYAVKKDGQRFLVNARPQQSGASPLTVVVNWTAAIQK